MEKVENVFNEMKLITCCCRVEIDESIRQSIKEILTQPIDWDFVIRESNSHGVGLLIYYNLIKINSDILPQYVFTGWRNGYKLTLYRNLQLWEEFCCIQEALNQAKIGVIPIKGIILAHTLYHNLGLRPMADIDILVREEDVHKAEGIVPQLGYNKVTRTTKNYYRSHHCDVTYMKEGLAGQTIILDMHWNFVISRPRRIDFTNVWERTERNFINHTEVLLLSPEDTLFSLCLHLRRHIRHLCLKHICDISELLISYKDRLDWNYIVNKARGNRMRFTLYFAFFSAQELLDTDVPQTILDRLKPGLFRRRLIRCFISKERFLYRRFNDFNFKGYWQIGIFLHFLILDSIRDFVIYTMLVPIEEFSKFFSLPLESKKTIFIYHIRFIYMPLRIVIYLIDALVNLPLKPLRQNSLTN